MLLSEFSLGRRLSCLSLLLNHFVDVFSSFGPSSYKVYFCHFWSSMIHQGWAVQLFCRVLLEGGSYSSRFSLFPVGKP